MKNLRGIVYISKALVNFDKSHLKELVEIASKKNKKLDVTGYLFFEKGTFLQYIEGEKDSVQGLMDIIEADDRHRVIKTLTKDDFFIRKFPNWSMKYLTKEMLSELKMENIIINRMEYLKKIDEFPNDIIDSQKEETVWRIINKLSKVASISS